MHKIGLLLACTACIGYGRRLSPAADDQKLPKKVLTTVLGAGNSKAAFNPSSSGAHRRFSSLAASGSSRARPVRRNPTAISALVASRATPVMVADTQQPKELDGDAVTRYVGAIALQMAALGAAFASVDAVTNVALGGQPLPWQAVTAIFFLLSLRSRAFSPLNNSRPDLKKATGGEKTGGFNDRIMPSWTPPGVVFPIMWVLIVAPLRAYSSTLVWEANGGHLLDPTLLCLMLHLSIGDTWNTINNVERRVGAAVPGVACVWLSVLLATSQYFQSNALAGQLLAVTVAWITVAGTLVADTWRVNNEVTPEPLYPYKQDDVTTRFFFESS
mmetsp:Transcript_73907/g.135074  ORF Transcript_73907/g.135074 Transcript_73907/m.135074 type:complete len:330 (-) Transcript_73907:186-1175(-)